MPARGPVAPTLADPDAMAEVAQAEDLSASMKKQREALAALDEAAGSQEGVRATVDYFVAKIFQSEHYQTLHQTLSSHWDRLHSLSAAMKLMEQFGVEISPEEAEKLSGLSEDQQIATLVTKMPTQSNEQFQEFFLKLQLLVSTATRVRLALEDGRPESVAEALQQAEGMGLSNYLLRLAVVQAGSEVSLLRQRYEAFVRDWDARMGRLIRGQEDAMQAQKKLASAQAQLAQFTTGQNEKAKKVLMSFASGNTKALVSGCFGAWFQYYKEVKVQGSIRKEYEERLELAEKRLIDYKATQLKNVRGVMEKKAKDYDASLLVDVFKIWKEEIEYQKDLRANAGKVKELEDMLKQARSGQAEATKKVMARMNMDNDKTLLGMCMQTWVAFCEEYKKDKEMNDKVKEAEKAFQKFLKEKSAGASKVMQGMSGASETGLLSTVTEAWRQVVKDAKMEAEMAERLAAANSRFGGFAERNTGNARSVMERSRQHLDRMLMMKTWQTWKLDSRMESTLRLYHAKIDAKRSQLIGVQSMFRGFAVQLEAGLKDGDDSARADIKNLAPKPRKMVKSPHTISLPDINSKSK